MATNAERAARATDTLKYHANTHGLEAVNNDGQEDHTTIVWHLLCDILHLVGAEEFRKTMLEAEVEYYYETCCGTTTLVPASESDSLAVLRDDFTQRNPASPGASRLPARRVTEERWKSFGWVVLEVEEERCQ